MKAWMSCNKCGESSYQEIMTSNRCPKCGCVCECVGYHPTTTTGGIPAQIANMRNPKHRKEEAQFRS